MGRTAKATNGREQRVAMDSDTRMQLLHDLELKHQQNAGESGLLFKDEDIRRLRLRILLLRDENTSLRDQIDQNGEANAKLTAKCDTLSAQLEAKIDAVRLQEKQLRKQEREYSVLQAELQSMNSATQDSASLLSEKLSLSRELAVLKPELEHLRSQVNHQQSTLAEKLALERQVNTLEVELANEKKAIKRAMQKRESNDRVEDDLRKKLRETEKKLTDEKTERERLEDQLQQEKRTNQFALQDQDSTRELEADLRKKLRDALRQTRQEKEDRERLEEELQATKQASKGLKKAKGDNEAEAELQAQLEESKINIAALRKENAHLRHESQTATGEAEARGEQLEKRLEKMKTKLRETQEQLKQCQTELRKAQQQAARSTVPEDSTRMNAKSQAFRKRKAQHMATDDFTSITIQTPGAEDTIKDRRKFKMRAIEPTVVGEKSTFSITPFLNRTRNDTSANSDGPSSDSAAAPQQVSEVVEPTPTDPAAAASSEPAEVEATAEVSKGEDDKAPAKTRGRPRKVLGEAPSAKKNAMAPTTAAKKTVKTKGSLEKVAENADAETGVVVDGGEQQQQPEPEAKKKKMPAAEKTTTVKFNFTLPADESGSTTSANILNGEQQQPKKKKRKVLGSTKTLFDDEDDGGGGGAGEAPALGLARKPSKVQLGGGGGSAAAAAAAAKRTSKAPLGAVKRTNAFAGAATFSPLKRERRGVGASFLA
ncbi:hypothetical protein GGR56DRAFT_697553 [Xylariaceae sp. FL0804]|nr:hypothetical protein GGR56DRAFT_697553 [Xylariaceae sp. FL0804]